MFRARWRWQCEKARRVPGSLRLWCTARAPTNTHTHEQMSCRSYASFALYCPACPQSKV